MNSLKLHLVTVIVILFQNSTHSRVNYMIQQIYISPEKHNYRAFPSLTCIRYLTNAEYPGATLHCTTPFTN